MRKKKVKEDPAPPGGWMGPPVTRGLAAIATVVGSKKGKWTWEKNKLTAKELKAHKKFQKAMKKANKKDNRSVNW